MGRLTVQPGVLQGSQDVFDEVERVVATLDFDVVVVSWWRPGAIVAGSDRTSLHATGDALDLRPKGFRFAESSPCDGARLDARSMQKLDALASALSAAGLTEDGPLWRTCTGGNHFDHVHTGGKPGKSSDPATPGRAPGESSGGGLSALTSGETWIRVGEVVGGVVLIAGGVLIMAKEGVV